MQAGFIASVAGSSCIRAGLTCVMDIDLLKIGNRVREALATKGVTSAEAAEMLEVSRATVSQWYKGRNLTLRTLWMLSSRLNLSLNWLVYGFGDMDRVSSLEITEKEEALLTITRHMENDVAPVISMLFKSIARYNSGLTNIENQSGADRIFELAKIARVTFLLDGGIADSSAYFRELVGLPEEDESAAGLNCMDLFVPQYRPQLKKMMEEVKAVGRSGYIYYELKHHVSRERIPVISKSSLTTRGTRLAFELLLKPVSHEHVKDIC